MVNVSCFQGQSLLLSPRENSSTPADEPVDGDLFEVEVFFDFSPRGAEPERLRGLRDLARESEVDALGLGVLNRAELAPGS